MRQKKILSAIIALAMIASMSVSVCAVDYGPTGGGGGGGTATPTVTTNTTSNTTASDTSGTSDTSDSSASGDSSGEAAAEANFEEVQVADLPDASFNVTAAAVEEAITSGESITITADNSNITARAIQILAQSDTPVTFVSALCEISIDPATITSIGAIDLGMSISASSNTDEVIIQPAMSGAFGMELQITIPKASLGGVDPHGKELIYVDDNGKEKNMGPVKVDKKGSAVITIDHASHYVLRPAFEDISAGAGLYDEGTVIEAD